MDSSVHVKCSSTSKKSVCYPFCVVWTPMPVISWIIPVIGHMGICTSQGKVRDFVRSYYVADDNMAFGAPTIYWQLNLDFVKNGISGWDHAIRETSLEYGSKILLGQCACGVSHTPEEHETNPKAMLQHLSDKIPANVNLLNKCYDNCHSFVAKALNLMEYQGYTNWNGFDVAYNVFKNGTYVTNTAMMKTWFPFFQFATLSTIGFIILYQLGYVYIR